jgi:predicted metal-binding membrane protein
MIGALPRTSRRIAGVPPVVLFAIGVAWIAAVLAQATSGGRLLHHDTLVEGGLPIGVALGAFVLAWQLMIAAMMLPSSLPLIRAFGVTAANQPNAARANVALIGGYAAVWTVFGVVAFALDIGIHSLVERWSWLETHPQVIAGSVLVLAGAFQFSDLKERCLRECRHPGPFLVQHYARGAAAAFRLGRAHGLFCLGCCWALMLVGFAAGVANLWWMVALTAVMVVEKTGRSGDRLVAPIGLALIGAGAVTLVPAFAPF